MRKGQANQEYASMPDLTLRPMTRRDMGIVHFEAILHASGVSPTIGAIQALRKATASMFEYAFIHDQHVAGVRVRDFGVS